MKKLTKGAKVGLAACLLVLFALSAGVPTMALAIFLDSTSSIENVFTYDAALAEPANRSIPTSAANSDAENENGSSDEEPAAISENESEVQNQPGAEQSDSPLETSEADGLSGAEPAPESGDDAVTDPSESER